MSKFILPFEKLTELATDGAPATVCLQKGLTALVKKEITGHDLAAGDLLICYCIMHQQNLCTKLLLLGNCMPIDKMHQFNQTQRSELVA